MVMVVDEMVGSCGCDGCTDDSLIRFNLESDSRGISILCRFGDCVFGYWFRLGR